MKALTVAYFPDLCSDVCRQASNVCPEDIPLLPGYTYKRHHGFILLSREEREEMIMAIGPPIQSKGYHHGTLFNLAGDHFGRHRKCGAGYLDTSASPSLLDGKAVWSVIIHNKPGSWEMYSRDLTDQNTMAAVAKALGALCYFHWTGAAAVNDWTGFPELLQD